MHLILAFLAALLILTILYRAWHGMGVVPGAPRGSWGANPSTDDPRVAAAGMMVAIATEDGPLTSAEELQIVSQLVSTVGLDRTTAEKCLTAGRRLARSLEGDLNSRLHQMKTPIDAQCSQKEKQEVVDMLHAIAGRNAEADPAVRNGLGRLSATLLNG